MVIDSESALASQLRGKRAAYCHSLTIRALLRALPYASEYYFPELRRKSSNSRALLGIFRLAFVSSAKVEYSSNVSPAWLVEALQSSIFRDDSPVYALGLAARSILDPIAFQKLVPRSIFSTIEFAAESQHRRLDGNRIHGGFVKGLNSDLELLHSGLPTKALNGVKLWPDGQPDWFVKYWMDLDASLRHLRAGWEIWADWYDDKLNGRIPYSLPPRASKSFAVDFCRLPSGFWNRDPETVNNDILNQLSVYKTHEVLAGGQLQDRTKTELLENGVVKYLVEKRAPATTSDIRTGLAGQHLYPTKSSLGWILSNLSREEKIVRERRGVYRSLSSINVLDFEKVEPQTPGALQFGTREDGKIDVLRGGSVSALANDSLAQKRHSELRRRIDQFIRSYGHSEQGGNASKILLEEVHLFKESVGDAIERVDADLLIPRGDGLRSDLRALRDRDEFSKIPPIPDDSFSALEKLIGAYNNYVSLDPQLAKRDEALLGPDARKRMVSPQDGQALAGDAVSKQAAAQAVVEVLGEEAKVAPSIPDIESRQSRRYSEGAKNLIRKAIELSVTFAQNVWRNKGKVLTTAGIVSVTGYNAARWVVANQQWLLGFFAENPTMLSIVRQLLELLGKLPLG